MSRFQLTLESPVTAVAIAYEGYVVADGLLQALPAGAFLDRNAGEFFWQPGVGFTGLYDMVFVRIAGETTRKDTGGGADYREVTRPATVPRHDHTPP